MVLARELDRHQIAAIAADMGASLLVIFNGLRLLATSQYSPKQP